MNAQQQSRELKFVLLQAALAPATLYYVGSRLAYGDLDAQTRWLAGALTASISVTATSLAGMSALLDRFAARTDLLRSVGVSKRAYFAVQLATVAGAALVFAGVLMLLVGSTRAFTSAEAMRIALSCGLGATASGGLGLLIASRARSVESGASATISGSYVLLLASPVFYSQGSLMLPLRALAWLSPHTHVATLVEGALRHQPLPLAPVLALVALSVALSALSYRWFKWER